MASPIITTRTVALTSTGTFGLTLPTLGNIVNGFNYEVDFAFSAGQTGNFGSPSFGRLFGMQAVIKGQNIGPTIGAAFLKSLSCGGLGLGATSGTISSLITDPTGTWSLSCDMVEISTFASTNGRYGTWTIQHQPKAGGTISGTVTFNHETQSFSGTIIPSMVVPLLAFLGHQTQTSLSIDPGTQVIAGTCDAFIDATFMGQAMQTAFAHAYPVGSHNTAHVDLSSGLSIAITSTLSNPMDAGGVAFAYNQQPTKQCLFTGKLKAFEEDYPGTIAMEWNNGVGGPYTPFNFGDTIGLDNYSASIAGFTGKFGSVGIIAGPTPSLAQGDGVAARMNAASLATNGEVAGGPEGSRICARLKPFDALTIWQDASVVFDPCTAISTPSSSWSANVSLVGGHLQIDSSSLSGIATDTHAFGVPIVIAEGYRYIEFDIQPNATSGGMLGLHLNNARSQGSSIEWEYQSALGASGATTTVRFDMLAPYAVTGGSVTDAYASCVKDSKGFGGPGIGNGQFLFPSDGPGWGIDQIWTIKLLFAPASGTYQLKAVRLIRDAAPKLTFLQSDHGAVEDWPTYVGSRTLWYKYALARTDGKRSMEIGDINQSAFPSVRFPSAGLGTFSGIANLIPGWHVTPIVSSGDAAAWYFTWWLGMVGGAGAVYTGTDPAFYWIDYSLPSNPTTIQCQGLADAVIFPPQTGDLANMGAISGPFAHYSYTFLRARGTGIALDAATISPLVGNTATISQVPSSAGQGSGVTDSKGVFITGDDYAQTSKGQKAVLSGVDPTSGTITPLPVNSKDTLRMVFLGQPVMGGPAYHLQDGLGRVHEAVIIAGDVWYRRSDHAVPKPSWLFFNQATAYGDVTYASMDFEPNSGILYMMVERHTAGVYNTYLASSLDGGKSWTAGTLYMASARPLNPFRTAMGGFGYGWFVYDSGSSGPGKVYFTVRNAGDTSWPTPWVAKDNTGTALSIADGGWGNVQMPVGDAGNLTWTPIIQGQPSNSFLFTMDMGKSWTLLP